MAIGPIDYSSIAFGQDIAGPAAQLGQQIQRIRGERKASQALQQYRSDLQRTFESGKPQDFAALVAKYPQQREALAQSWELLDKGQRETEFKEASRVYRALNFAPGTALEMIDERIEAEENAGQDTTELKQIRELAQSDPKAASNYLAFTLSSVDPERWATMATEQRAAEKAPADLTKAEAEAQKAAVAANFAESNAVADLRQKGWETAKLQNDIDVSRQNAKIAAMNAALAKEQNDLKRQELQQKLADAKEKRDAAVREKAAEASNAAGTIDVLLDTADRILQTQPEVIEAATGTYQGTGFGQFLNIQDQQKITDFRALAETLGNQITMGRIGEMTGVLSDSDLKVLRSSLQSLDLTQSSEQLLKNVQQIQRIMLKNRAKIAEKYGVPPTVPDRPNIETLPEEPAGDVPTVPQTGGFRVLGIE